MTKENANSDPSFQHLCKELGDRFSEISSELRVNAQLISSIGDSDSLSESESAFLITMKSKIEQLSGVLDRALAAD